MGFDIALAFALRHWKLIAIGLAAAALFSYVMWLRADNADLRAEVVTYEAELQRAAEVNARNAEFMRRQNDNLVAERAATAKVQKRVTALQAEINSAEQELLNAPGANDPAGEFFDALGDRLRAIDAR